jgi:hypothetical protein
LLLATEEDYFKSGKQALRGIGSGRMLDLNEYVGWGSWHN